MTCGVALYAFLSLISAPEDRGPHLFATHDAGSVAAAGEMIPLSVYYPTDLTGPGPLVAVVHGFVRNGSFMAEMARTLASRGMIAIVPDMPCGLVGGCNHEENGAQISALMDWAINESSTNMMSPIYGLIDSSKLGVIGHSWGGLGVFMSALNDPRYLSVVTLDPNDDRSLAADNAPMMTRPSMAIMAEVSGNCNATNWGDTVYPLTPAPHMRIRIVGSGHCDVEDPTDSFCPTFCNAGDPATTPLFRRYTVAFTECQLLGLNPEWIGGAELDADVMRGAIDNVDSAGIDMFACRSTVMPPDDAGVPIDEDAGEAPQPDASDPADAIDPPGHDVGGMAAADAAENADAAATIDADAGVVEMTPGPTTIDDGCGCTSGRHSRNPSAWLFLPLLLLAYRISDASRRRRSG